MGKAHAHDTERDWLEVVRIGRIKIFFNLLTFDGYYSFVSLSYILSHLSVYQL